MASSIIRSLVDKVTFRHHIGESKMIAKEGAVAVATGALLGAVSGKRHGGLDVKGVPLDALGGALVMVGSIGSHNKAEVRDAVRQAGGIALGIGSFRASERFSKTGKLLAHGEFDGAEGHGGLMGEDPIRRAALDL